MSKRVNLLEGNILKALITMSVPIMGTSLLQMAYSMVDMIWIGRVGSNAVAAVGTAGMFVNLAGGLSAFARVGGQVNVAQSYGAGDKMRAANIARNAIQIGLAMGILYMAIILLFSKQFIGFFELTEVEVARDAEVYLRWMGSFMIFNFLNPLCTSMITATGNSKTPFMVNTIGLVINMVLDPFLIFGWGPFPRMEIVGAAFATVFAQAVVCALYISYLWKDKEVFRHMNFRKLPDFPVLKDIVKVGIPMSVQGILFTGIAMVIGKVVAGFGAAAIAAQKVGVQVESISYLAADGFAAATNSFIAQNYGAGNLKRAKKGYATAFKVIVAWGIVTSVILIFLPEPIMRVFVTEPDTIAIGVDYLRILGYSQCFMCVEILASNAFAAYGETMIPSTTSIILTGMRVPLAILLGATVLGSDGVWWTITGTSVVKGVVMVLFFSLYMRKMMQKHEMKAQKC